MRETWRAALNVGTEYENNYFGKQNIILLNEYTIILFFIFVIHIIQSLIFSNYYFTQYVFSGLLLVCIPLFLLTTMTVPAIIKLRRVKAFLCMEVLLVCLIIFYYESFCGGNSGIYFYFFPLMLALPFIFDIKTDMIYIVIILVAILLAIFVNAITNYSLFSCEFYSSNPQRQKSLFYVSLFFSIFIFILDIVFITKKTYTIYNLYNLKQIADLENKNMQQKMEMKNLEVLNAKQELLITNLRIAQKNELLEKTREMDSKQINKLIRQEKSKDKNFDDVSQMYLDISPEFYHSLKEKALPNKLSALDLKYCAYIYTHKSNKDIAEILNIGYSSVKSHKRHLKHKLHLIGTDNLDIFIQSITLNA